MCMYISSCFGALVEGRLENTNRVYMYYSNYSTCLKYSNRCIFQTDGLQIVQKNPL